MIAGAQVLWTRWDEDWGTVAPVPPSRLVYLALEDAMADILQDRWTGGALHDLLNLASGLDTPADLPLDPLVTITAHRNLEALAWCAEGYCEPALESLRCVLQGLIDHGNQVRVRPFQEFAGGFHAQRIGRDPRVWVEATRRLQHALFGLELTYVWHPNDLRGLRWLSAVDVGPDDEIGITVHGPQDFDRLSRHATWCRENGLGLSLTEWKLDALGAPPWPDGPRSPGAEEFVDRCLELAGDALSSWVYKARTWDTVTPDGDRRHNDSSIAGSGAFEERIARLITEGSPWRS